MPDAYEVQSRGVCLASYRIDASSRAWAFLVTSAVLISAGAMGVCTTFVTRGLFARTEWYAVVGAACMLAGLALAVLVAWPVITHDEYVAALEEGVLWKLGGEERFVPWSEIADVKWHAEGKAIVIRLRKGEPVAIVRSFGRVAAAEVAPKLDDFRRKADFHLI